MSLFNFIKTILNIQDDNISFPEEDYCQVTQKDNSLKRKLKLFWKLLQKYYPDLCQKPYYCPSFKYKLSTKDKVDYLLEKNPELDVNFNIYQDILQAIRHNDFKRFESIVKKYLTNKEKISKKMIIALRT